MRNIFSGQALLVWAVIAVLFALATLTGCSNMPIADFKAHITLPASGDGYWVKTASPDEGRIPKAEWAIMSKRAVLILKEDWMILRNSMLENCLKSPSCKSVVGTFDALFYAIDDALGKLPKP